MRDGSGVFDPREGEAPLARGFFTDSLSNYYEGATTGLAPGATQFIVLVLFSPARNLDVSKVHPIARNINGTTGWEMWWQYGQFQARVYVGGVETALQIPQNLLFSNIRVGSFFAVALRVTESAGTTTVSVWVGPGPHEFTASQSGAVSPASAGTLRIGWTTAFTDERDARSGYFGLGYLSGTLTDDQLRTAIGTALSRRELPTDVVSWTLAYTGASFFTVPATVTPAVGTGNLTKVGSPTGISVRLPVADMGGYTPYGGGGLTTYDVARRLLMFGSKS